MDRSFAYLTSTADHLYYYDSVSDPTYHDIRNYSKSKIRNYGLQNSQKTLFLRNKSLRLLLYGVPRKADSDPISVTSQYSM